MWQTLILSRWKPELAFLPVEEVIRERQAAYYRALSKADRIANSTPIIEFLLTALESALLRMASTDQVDDQVNDQVRHRILPLLSLLHEGPKSASELMRCMGRKHLATFRNNYLKPALIQKWIERSQPNSPSSPTQTYRITRSGLQWLRKKGHSKNH